MYCIHKFLKDNRLVIKFTTIDIITHEKCDVVEFIGGTFLV